MSDPDTTKDEAKKQGERLGFLIASLNLADDVKESLIAILPQMTPDQLNRLSATLESAYQSDKTEGVDQNLQTALGQIQTAYDKEVESADKKALSDLKKLEKDLNARSAN